MNITINISKKKSIIGGILAALSLIVAVLALRPLKSEPSVTQEHFDLLRTGMTRADVERLLDGPPRNGLRYPAIVWLPQAAGRPISAEIGPVSAAIDLFSREDRPKSAPQRVQPAALDFFPLKTEPDGHQAVWNTREQLIAVYFGPDGQLRQKYHSTVHEPVQPSRPRMMLRALGF